MKHIAQFENFKKQPTPDAQPVNEQNYWGSMAAGIMPVCSSTGRVLIAFRSAHVNEPHTWGTIGGKLDIDEGIDETIEEAALRELVEETEYDGDMDMRKAYVFTDGSFSYHNFFGVVSEEFEPQLNWETERFEWMTFRELKQLSPKHFGLSALLKNSGGELSALLLDDDDHDGFEDGTTSYR